MMRRKSLIIASVAATSAAIALAVASCGKKSSDDDAVDTNPVSSNPAALAYPTSLAITAFPASTGTSLTEDDASSSTAKAKNLEQEKLLRGEGDTCAPKIMGQVEQAGTQNDCYEFDQDMIYGKRQDGKYYGTRNGKDTAGEACLVVFSRAQVKQVVGHVDRALGLAQAALCQRKKSGETSQPEIGAEIDLKTHLSTALVGSTVTSAKMKRLADASDGAKVFSMSFDMTRKDGIPMVVNIIHSPKNDANTSYTGVINAKITMTNDSKPRFISVMYDRSDSAMKYNLRSASVASALAANAIGSDGQLDFNVGAGADHNYTGYSSQNDAVSAMHYVAFEGSTTTNAGTFSYWQNPGGNYIEKARGMLASLTYDEATGTLSGSAVSGAAVINNDGYSIRKAIFAEKNLEPGGAFHPFFNTDSGCTSSTGTDTIGTYYTCSESAAKKWYIPKGLGENGTTFVTRQMPALYTKQSFKQNASGVYELTTTGEAGFELIATTDTANKITPPKPPVPGAGVKVE